MSASQIGWREKERGEPGWRRSGGRQVDGELGLVRNVMCCIRLDSLKAPSQACRYLKSFESWAVRILFNTLFLFFFFFKMSEFQMLIKGCNSLTSHFMRPVNAKKEKEKKKGKTRLTKTDLSLISFWFILKWLNIWNPLTLDPFTSPQKWDHYSLSGFMSSFRQHTREELSDYEKSD